MILIFEPVTIKKKTLSEAQKAAVATIRRLDKLSVTF
jgi:hypothetical protein